MKKARIPIAKSYRIINYGPVVLVSSAAGKRANLATIAWAVPLSSDPPLVGVAVYEEHYTARLVSKSKEFVINVPGASLLKKVKDCGSIHGFKTDKFEKFRLTQLPATKVKAPLVAECYAHLECKLRKKIKIGDHYLFVGKIVHASVDKGIMTSRGTVNIKKIRTLHHLGGDEFGTLKRL
jgi:flavin reductase (DIM6/NTAB) family NADH-FMN oxidoreductase RutF